MSHNNANANSNHRSLAKFAFNIYGTLNQSDITSGPTTPQKSSTSLDRLALAGHTTKHDNKLIYNCEKEVSCLSELNLPLNNIVGSYYDRVPSNHVIIGGKNYLKLLALNTDQSSILNEINLLDQHNPVYSASSRLQTTKLNNVNTIKSQNDVIACGLSNGIISIYKVNNNGKSKLIQKFSDHKRCINSLDFIGASSKYDQPQQLLSGSQDGTMKLWDLRTAVAKPVMTIASSSHSDPIRACQYSPHSTVRNRLTVLSVHDSGSLCKFDLRSPSGGASGGSSHFSSNPLQHQVSMPERKLNFHTGPALSLHIHPEEEYVITGGRDKKLCIWNYRDSQPHHTKATPDHIVHTYGPVMKVRWGEYPNERSADQGISPRNSTLSNYDFACSYLNEDTTITVFNLQRKYIPKEIITTTSKKPFQNFIWAQNQEQTRKLWTITKSNVFASYSLNNITDETAPNVMRPLEHLSQVSMAWNSGAGGLCFVNQKRDEFQCFSPGEGDTNTSKKDQHTDTTVPESVSDHNYSSDANGSIAQSDTATGLWDDAPSDQRTSDHQSAIDNSSIYNTTRFNIGSLPVASNSQFSSNAASMTSSPIEKPSFTRSSTYNSGLLAVKSPSPIPQQRATNPMEILSNSTGISAPSGIQRPQLKRNASQTTQGSGVSLGSSPIHQSNTPFLQQHSQMHNQAHQRRLINIQHPSPYLVPISLPIPLNDDDVFKALSDSYLIEVPESFNLIDVCYINARVAAAVNRFRDCQVWRMLAISLEQDPISYEEFQPLDDFKRDLNHRESTHFNDDKSLSSDIGNIVGSYNSNSTSTTNYGGTNGTGGETTGGNSYDSSGGLDPIHTTKDRNLQAFADQRNTSSQSLIDAVSSNRIPRFDSQTSLAMKSRNDITNTTQRQHSDEQREGSSIYMTNPHPDPTQSVPQNEKLVSPTRRVSDSKSDTYTDISSEASSPVNMRFSESAPWTNRSGSPRNTPSSRFYAPRHQQKSAPTPAGTIVTGQDLDDENSHFLNNAASSITNGGFTPPFPGSVVLPGNSPNFYSHKQSPRHSLYSSGRSYGSDLSRKNSFGAFGSSSNKSGSLQNLKATPQPLASYQQDSFTELKKVDEKPEDQKSFETKRSVATRSELTKAFHESSKESTDTTERIRHDVPWSTSNLLQHTLEYSIMQGDIILSATLVLLFYDYFNEQNGGGIKRQCSLECLALYIEILRKKQLFVSASNVVKVAPKELSSQLNSLANSDVNLRFYCSWCQKLLLNERSKAQLNHRQEHSEAFGYWYCDECSKRQRNCIYCCEPCTGLNVVVSLRCGHRGHFGCLREWFVEDENTECPGGCDESVFT